MKELLAKLSDISLARTVVPPIPRGMTVDLPTSDDPEGDTIGPDLGQIEPASFIMPEALFIRYRAASGKISNRRIACRRYEPERDAIVAWCFERGAIRRFLIQGIELCACPTTGEILEIAQICAGLRGGLPTEVDPRLARMLIVLVFIMLCDREAHPLERDAIERAATAFALRFDGDDRTVDVAVRQALRLAPSADEAVDAVRWIAASLEPTRLAKLIVRCIDDIVIPFIPYTHPHSSRVNRLAA